MEDTEDPAILPLHSDFSAIAFWPYVLDAVGAGLSAEGSPSILALVPLMRPGGFLLCVPEMALDADAVLVGQTAEPADLIGPSTKVEVQAADLDEDALLRQPSPAERRAIVVMLVDFSAEVGRFLTVLDTKDVVEELISFDFLESTEPGREHCSHHSSSTGDHLHPGRLEGENRSHGGWAAATNRQGIGITKTPVELSYNWITSSLAGPCQPGQGNATPEKFTSSEEDTTCHFFCRGGKRDGAGPPGGRIRTHSGDGSAVAGFDYFGFSSDSNFQRSNLIPVYEGGCQPCKAADRTCSTEGELLCQCDPTDGQTDATCNLTRCRNVGTSRQRHHADTVLGSLSGRWA